MALNVSQRGFLVLRIPVLINHLGSVTKAGRPFVPQSHLDAPQLSRRDFIRLSAIAAGAGLLMPAPPAAAQSMRSSEQELLADDGRGT